MLLLKTYIISIDCFSKMSGKADGKCSKEADSEDEFFDLGKNDAKFVPLNINILKIIFMTPEKDAIGAPLSIKIVFDIDREVVAGFWDLKVSNGFVSLVSIVQFELSRCSCCVVSR